MFAKLVNYKQDFQRGDSQNFVNEFGKNQSQITTADVINLIVMVVFGRAIFK